MLTTDPLNGVHQTPVSVIEQPLLDQVLEQTRYNPQVIDKVLMRGDLKDVEAAERLEFYRAVCLSVGLSPLTQPFILMERQDKSLWIYATAAACQQLAKVHRVSFRDMKRVVETVLGEPMCRTEVTAYTPDGRCVPAQGVVSLTKKKREQAGKWPSGDPKFRDALDADGEPVLIPLRGDALANALKKADTQALRRATLALLGLGWIQTEDGGRPVQINMQTGEILDDVIAETVRQPLTQRPEEQGKTAQAHASDLFGDTAPVQAALAAARQGADDYGTVAQAVEDQNRAKTLRAINEMHSDHGCDLNWIAAYWRKMEQRRFQVAPGSLSLEQLYALEEEVRAHYAKLAGQEAPQEPVGAILEEGAVPEVAQETQSAPTELLEAFPAHPDTSAWRALRAHVHNSALPEWLKEKAFDTLMSENCREDVAFSVASNILDTLEGRGREPEAQGSLI